MEDKVLTFISHFSNFGPQVVDCFTCGNCYWFAQILFGRFCGKAAAVHLTYDDIENHWGCYINGRIYDITGDVTEQYNWERWYDVAKRDPLHTAVLYRDCIDF